MNEDLTKVVEEFAGADTKKYIHTYGDTCIIVSSEYDENSRYRHIFFPVIKAGDTSYMIAIPALVLDSNYFFNDIEGAVEDIKEYIELEEEKKGVVIATSLVCNGVRLSIWMYNIATKEFVLKRKGYPVVSAIVGAKANTPRILKKNGSPIFMKAVAL